MSVFCTWVLKSMGFGIRMNYIRIRPSIKNRIRIRPPRKTGFRSDPWIATKKRILIRYFDIKRIRIRPFSKYRPTKPPGSYGSAQPSKEATKYCYPPPKFRIRPSREIGSGFDPWKTTRIRILIRPFSNYGSGYNLFRKNGSGSDLFNQKKADQNTRIQTKHPDPYRRNHLIKKPSLLFWAGEFAALCKYFYPPATVSDPDPAYKKSRFRIWYYFNCLYWFGPHQIP